MPDEIESEGYVPSRIPEERPGPAGGRRHANRLARTRALCEAALGCFLERGLDAVTVDEVVQAAGTSKGTFYRYFEGKDDLLAAAIRPTGAAVLGAMDRCSEALESARSPEALESAYAVLTGELLEVLLGQERAVQLFLQERHGPPTPARAAVLELDEAVVDRAVRMTLAGQASGLLKPVDARVTALSVVGAIHELLWQQLRGRGPETPLRAAQDLVDIVLHGVRRP